MNRVTIRPLRLTDYKLIHNFDRYLNFSYVVHHLELFYRRRGFCIVAVYDGKIIGNIDVCSETSKDIPDLSIYIQRKFRGRGIGKRLMKFAIKQCIEFGFKSLVLEVESSNHRAIALYKKCGFEVTSRTLSSDNLNIIRMKLKLLA